MGSNEGVQRGIKHKSLCKKPSNRSTVCCWENVALKERTFRLRYKLIMYPVVQRVTTVLGASLLNNLYWWCSLLLSFILAIQQQLYDFVQYMLKKKKKLLWFYGT